MLALPLQLLSLLPAPAAITTPRPIVTGGSTGNILYGKLQRAAQLPTSGIAANPLAAVDDRGALEGMLWSQFAMASIPPGDALKRAEVGMTRSLQSSLLFIDGLPPEKSGWNLPLFGNSADPEAPPLDRSLLELAAERGATHAYILLENEAAVEECLIALASIPLYATIIAPEEGVTVQSTKGWICPALQDHEGSLVGAINVRNGILVNEDGTMQMVPTTMTAPATIAREDLAELAVQCTLRLAKTTEEGAPPVRVLRVAPADANSLAERPYKSYDAVVGGAKTRKRLGTVESADWTTLLSPFGVIRKSDPDDWRLLIDA